MGLWLMYLKSRTGGWKGGREGRRKEEKKGGREERLLSSFDLNKQDL